MNRHPHARFYARCQGVTILEVLVAIVIVSFALLGLAGLQTIGLRNNASAGVRTQATILAYDMADRMRANMAGVNAGNYHKPNNADYTTAVGACLTTAGCTVADMAQNDAKEWRDAIVAALPGGLSIVCRDSTNTPNDGTYDGVTLTPACDNLGTTYAIKLWWNDDRIAPGSGNYKRFVITVRP